MSKDIFAELNRMSEVPRRGTDHYGQRLGQKEFLRFLKDSSSGEIPLHVSYRGVLIYSVFLERSLLRGDYIDDLMKCDCRPDSTWGYDYSPRRHRASKGIAVLSPYAFSKSKLLKKATPVTILRNFEGMTGPKSYMVVNQLLSHPNDLHFEKERGAYCRLNKKGEVEEVIKIRHRPGETSVTITEEILDRHLFLTKSVLVRFFERTLCPDRAGPGEKRKRESKLRDGRNKTYARRVMVFDEGNMPVSSSLRGFQIISCRLSPKEGTALLAIPAFK